MISLTSDAFVAQQPIPARHTCDGEDLSPRLSWAGAPQNTVAYALIVDDPDAPGGVFTHWVLYDLPGSLAGLPEGVPRTERPGPGGVNGRNDFGSTGYRGPCPPSGRPHRYRFTLYALDAALNLRPAASKQQVFDAMRGHILDQGELVGTYQRRGR